MRISVFNSALRDGRESQPVSLMRGSTFPLHPYQKVGEGSQINERPGFPINGTLSMLCFVPFGFTKQPQE